MLKANPANIQPLELLYRYMKNEFKEAKILVVDDQKEDRKYIGEILLKAGFDVVYAPEAFPALQKVKSDPKIELIALDLEMQQMHGLELIPRIQEIRNNIPIIIVTGKASISTAVKAIQLGAYDYIEKGFEEDRLLLTISNALKQSRVIAENSRLREKELSEIEIIGNSAPITDLKKLIEKVAQSDRTVLITGETGTGKELIARNIHLKSKRVNKPLIVVNCNSIPDQLFESDLFGHVKGSFTDARSDRKGKYELANGGNIFIDEIGDLDMGLQAKLLRILEDGLVPKVGLEEPIPVDVRHILATKVDLKKAIKKGKFRNDLYYRINVINIDVPPLRDHRDDIPLLLKSFMNITCLEESVENPGVSPEAMRLLIEYDWPGNVRELKSIVERLMLYNEGDEIRMEDVTQVLLDVDASKGAVQKISLSVDECMKTEIIKALNHTGGKKREAAKLLGISPAQFYRYLEKFQLLNNS